MKTEEGNRGTIFQDLDDLQEEARRYREWCEIRYRIDHKMGIDVRRHTDPDKDLEASLSGDEEIPRGSVD